MGLVKAQVRIFWFGVLNFFLGSGRNGNGSISHGTPNPFIYPQSSDLAGRAPMGRTRYIGKMAKINKGKPRMNDVR
jgi:hypothetical protein